MTKHNDQTRARFSFADVAAILSESGLGAVQARDLRADFVRFDEARGVAERDARNHLRRVYEIAIDKDTGGVRVWNGCLLDDGWKVKDFATAREAVEALILTPGVRTEMSDEEVSRFDMDAEDQLAGAGYFLTPFGVSEACPQGVGVNAWLDEGGEPQPRGTYSCAMEAVSALLDGGRARCLAGEIVECWTEQAAPGVPMVVGTADEMGIHADLEHVPAELQTEVVALVREGFEAFNAKQARED